MFRTTLTALAMTGLLAFGCEEKTEAEKQADKVGEAASDKLESVQEKSQDGTAEAKKTTENMSDAAKDGAANVQNEVNDLISKAQTAVKDRKWSEAETYVARLDTLKAKLPEGARVEIDKMITDVKKMIETGKALPAMPK